MKNPFKINAQNIYTLYTVETNLTFSNFWNLEKQIVRIKSRNLSLKARGHVTPPLRPVVPVYPSSPPSVTHGLPAEVQAEPCTGSSTAVHGDKGRGRRTERYIHHAVYSHPALRD